jgi:hypothetical protein
MLNWISKQFLKTIIPATILISSNSFSQDNLSNTIPQNLEKKIELSQTTTNTNTTQSIIQDTTGTNNLEIKQEIKQKNTILIYSPVDSARISSRYGVWRKTHQHSGVDLAAGLNKEVYAAQNGVVEFVGWRGGYGYQIIINHGVDDVGQEIKTSYSHLSSRYKYTHKGDTVKTGDLISRVGKTGNIRGVHLHFEYIVNGKTKDPLQYIREGKKQINKSTVLVKKSPEEKIEQMPIKHTELLDNYLAQKEINMEMREQVHPKINFEKNKRKNKQILANLDLKIPSEVIASNNNIYNDEKEEILNTKESNKNVEKTLAYISPTLPKKITVERIQEPIFEIKEILFEKKIEPKIENSIPLIAEKKIQKEEKTYAENYNNLSNEELEALCPIPAVEIIAQRTKKEEIRESIEYVFDSPSTSKDSIEKILNKIKEYKYTAGENILRISKGYEKGTWNLENRLDTLLSYAKSIDAHYLTNEDKESIADTLVRLNEDRYLKQKILASKNLKQVKDTVQEQLIELVDIKTAGIQIAAYNSPEKNLTRVKNEVKKLYGYSPSDEEIKHDLVDGMHKYTLLVGRSKEEALSFAKNNRGQGMYGVVSYEDGKRLAEWKAIKSV